MTGWHCWEPGVRISAPQSVLSDLDSVSDIISLIWWVVSWILIKTLLQVTQLYAMSSLYCPDFISFFSPKQSVFWICFHKPAYIKIPICCVFHVGSCGLVSIVSDFYRCFKGSFYLLCCPMIPEFTSNKFQTKVSFLNLLFLPIFPKAWFYLFIYLCVQFICGMYRRACGCIHWPVCMRRLEQGVWSGVFLCRSLSFCLETRAGHLESFPLSVLLSWDRVCHWAVCS